MKKMPKVALLCAVSLSYFLTGCSNNEDSASSSTLNSITLKSSFSAVEVFKGIYFLDGGFVGEIPLLRDSYSSLPVLTQEDKDFLTLMEDEIINSILAEDPKYFDSFVSKLSADNLYDVELVYSEGLAKLKEAGLKSASLKGSFELANIFQQKRVDYSRPDIVDLDLSIQSDFDTFVGILKNDYDINYDSADGFEHTLVAASVFAHEKAGVFAKNKLYGHSTAYLFNKVKWFTDNDYTQGSNDVIVLQLSEYF